MTSTPSSAGPGWRQVGLVASGGALGTLARFALEALIGDAAGIPAGLLLINVSGAFALGLLVSVLATRPPGDPRGHELRLLLGTGLLGGYTTYSLLATDLALLWLDERFVAAAGYGLATIGLGGLATWLGLVAGERGIGRR